MPQLTNESERLDWRKSKRSMNGGNCTEVAAAPGTVVVRDSQDPHGPVIGYSADSWRSFVMQARSGSFDLSR